MYSRIFIPEVVLLSLGILLLAILFVDLSSNLLLLLIIFTLILDSIVLLLIGRRQRIEFEKISSIINAIRKTELDNPAEIKLDKYLYQLENDIREMYIKAQNDIKYLKKLEHARTEFLGNVSHELRTPIFAIQGYLETLMNGAIDDKKVNRSFLEKANHHTQRLNALLNDLIDISMIEAGQMRMSFRYFDIGEFLNEVVREFALQAEEKNIQLVLNKPDRVLRLYGDKDKLKQVMVNLIQNAIKYTEKGKVEISVNEANHFGEIIVKDTGIGIEKADIDRIFERFYRVDKDRSRTIGGTGLGLAIVKHILEAHGATIDLKSTPAVGSEFSFKLKR